MGIALDRIVYYAAGGDDAEGAARTPVDDNRRVEIRLLPASAFSS